MVFCRRSQKRNHLWSHQSNLLINVVSVSVWHWKSKLWTAWFAKHNSHRCPWYSLRVQVPCMIILPQWIALSTAGNSVGRKCITSLLDKSSSSPPPQPPPRHCITSICSFCLARIKVKRTEAAVMRSALIFFGSHLNAIIVISKRISHRYWITQISKSGFITD